MDAHSSHATLIGELADTRARLTRAEQRIEQMRLDMIRLHSLVRAAYEEGLQSGLDAHLTGSAQRGHSALWMQSQARLSLSTGDHPDAA